MAVVLILIIAAASFYFLRSSPNDQVIATSDVREISSEGIVARVSVNGNIEAARTTTIYTSLTVPVANLPVAVGDRVAADQVLAELDASALQRQLDETDANNARAAMANRNSIAQSQQAYEQSRELLDSGLSPEINSAQSSLRASSQAYQDAIRSFEAKQRDVDGGLDSTMVAQSDALKAAREQADAAEIERLRADFGLLNNDRSNLNDVIGLLDERESLASAESELAQARAAGDLEAVAAAEAKVAGL
ncbi:MAG: biotin/lipoyl-binding protein, partial [Corynebacterium glutamicum]|nr:biotin/lipoyl-binding protein [Corynebacterium glutamicum]